jgi:hypothetical protein
MKGLASGLCIILLAAFAAYAGPLEISIGGGPTATSLDDINASIVVFNTLIEHLNETFAVHPDVTGSVAPLMPMVSGLSLHASERYGFTDWLAVGAQLEYMRSSTSTAGSYQGAETSTIDIDLGFQSIGILLGARVTFLNLGLLLAADLGVGYYYASLDHDIVFQIPEEYPEVISGVPPEGSGHNAGGAMGFEAGLSLSYPVAPWLSLGSTVTYRSASIGRLTDANGAELDLDGTGVPETANLDGIVVQINFSILIDLSLDGGKE